MPRYQQDATPLKAAIQKMLDTYRLRGKYQESGLRGEWARIMGATIDKQTRDIQLRQGCLHIYLQSDVLSHELQYSRDTIQRRLNQAIGTEAIQSVKIHS